ncbi:hypothetical protein CPB83DRAFT_840459 [Crepidotus variabilis]|uniref:Uncharacterized protein n=1 Tax=Crepidotus variabilis TaxID=179855 RepID=A0A9P6E4M9_9AGAR|nr:hypothetical protein CPB83DRAFT_840459 [Crepidotus variabilis]
MIVTRRFRQTLTGYGIMSNKIKTYAKKASLQGYGGDVALRPLGESPRMNDPSTSTLFLEILTALVTLSDEDYSLFAVAGRSAFLFSQASQSELCPNIMQQHLKLKQMVILSPGRSSGYLDCRSAKYNIPMNQWRRDRGDIDNSPALDHWSVGIGISVSVAADSSTFRCQWRRERELWRLIGCSSIWLASTGLSVSAFTNSRPFPKLGAKLLHP